MPVACCWAIPIGVTAGRPHALEVAQDGVFALGDVARLLLEGDQAAIDDEEADEVARRPDREVAELEARGPGRERQLPWQVEQTAGAAEPEGREIDSCRLGLEQQDAEIPGRAAEQQPRRAERSVRARPEPVGQVVGRARAGAEPDRREPLAVPRQRRGEPSLRVGLEEHLDGLDRTRPPGRLDARRDAPR